ncbi:ABC transporter permease subunit [Halovenus salina]|uniref:ABC transporter permease subunit n=1 Tax=Halovenus salina TaxID=1510225 RepID=A0ABD5VWK8_9EURY|nr:ABC transporter permease subunit [Halovenus salina]
MLETARHEGRRRLKGTAVLTVAIALYSGFIVWYFSALEGVEYEELFQEAPAAIRNAFGIEALSTVEGFLSAQIFNFVWLLGLGLYFAYTAGGLIAGDIENERMDLLLSFPISRSRLLLELFTSLLVPIAVVNAVTAGVLYGLVAAIGESIDPVALAVVHLLSVPYLLVCAGIGLVFSVSVDRAAIAERAGVGLVFTLFLVESVVGGSTDFEVLRYLSPTNYYQPTEILVTNSYSVTDTAVLLVAFLVLLAVSQALFRRRDI